VEKELGLACADFFELVATDRGTDDAHSGSTFGSPLPSCRRRCPLRRALPLLLLACQTCRAAC
jgi:hypothetical protein